jgi:hypothetical protein
VRILAGIAIVVNTFALPRTSHEHRCFLHCDGEPETQITALGWPAAYWSHDALPGDPPRVSPARLDPAALVLDVVVLGLLLCALAIVTSARPRPARLHANVARHCPASTKAPTRM